MALPTPSILVILHASNPYSRGLGVNSQWLTITGYR